ncbi:MAG: carbonic anhydrase [Flavobacteriaceae bacterium]|nr:carbonic anhydrase [Flavobacteriaceae bacterium]
MGNTKENADKMTLDIAVKTLKTGNENFVKNPSTNRDLKAEVKRTSGGQTPFAAVLSCIDSRVPVETIFDLGIGDVFSFRAAGNFVDQKSHENNNILGSLEFAKHSGVQLILVLGHSRCGAIQTAISGGATERKQIDEMIVRLRENITTKDEKEATKENVRNTIKHIREQSHYLDGFEIIGGVYDIVTGEVEFL